MNLPSPPIFFMVAVPGLRLKRKELLMVACVPRLVSASEVRCFAVPFVATGMKNGVVIVFVFVVNVPVRALPSSCVIVNGCIIMVVQQIFI